MPLLGRNARPGRVRALIARPGRAIVASAQRAQDSKGALQRLNLPWQERAMHVYNTQGECANPAQYQARAMARIRYFPAIRDERGVPEETTDPDLLRLFNMIRSPGGNPGDLSEIATNYATLQFVIGDGLLTVSEDTDDSALEAWEYLSPMELRVQRNDDLRPQDYRRIRAPGVQPETLVEAPDNDFEPLSGDRVRVWRLWRRHPFYSQWADSPVRSVLELYETLARLTLAVGAEASSRAAQRGAWIIPSEWSFGPADPTQAENPDEDPLLEMIQTSMARAIANPGSAEAMAPFLFRVPGVTQTSGGSIATADLTKWIPLGPSDRYSEIEAWDATISRIAADIDMPKELFTGIGDLSHWSSWFLGDVGLREHTGPTVTRFCNDLGSAYLRPAAQAEHIANADRVTVWFDLADATTHPDQTGTALKAQDQGIISNEAARQKMGYPESAAPSEQERAEWVAIRLRQFPSDLQPEPQAGETSPAQGGRGGDTKEAPPSDVQNRPAGNRPPSPRPSMALQYRIEGAAQMQVDRARELAGNRLVRRAQSCDECRGMIADVPPALIASALGPEIVRSVIDGHATEASLVAGVGEAFARRLRAWGVNGHWPEQLGAMIEEHTVRTLYESEVPDLPSGFRAACQKAVS